jgi:predicted Zn-dependent protease
MVLRCDPGADDPAETATRLDAQVLVWLTLSAQDDGLFLTGTAESMPNRFRLWSETLRSRPSGIFDLAERVASGIRSRLASDGETPRQPQPAPDVTDLYLKARQAYHTFWYEGTARAVRLLEEALTVSPHDPVILAAHALASVRLSFFTGEGLETAKRSAIAASEAAPDDPIVHVALASIRLQRNELVEAVGHLRAALREAPSQPEANWLLGRILVEADLLAPAIQRLRWTLELEPDQHLVRLDLARALALHGQWDDVDILTAQAPEGHEAGNWLERARFAMWRHDVRAAASGLCIVPADPTGPVALAKELFEIVGRGEAPFGKPAYQAFLVGSRRTPRREAFAAQIEAEVDLALGRTEEALAAIERAVALGLTDLAWLNRCPLLTALGGSTSLEALQSLVSSRTRDVRDAVYGS